MNLKEDPVLLSWFERDEVSPGTRVNYRIYMEKFCEIAGKTPRELIDESNQETRQGLLLNERRSVDYIARFKKYLNDKEYAPKTFALGISTVKSFYRAHDIQLSSSIGKTKKRQSLPENHNVLKREDIIKLLTAAQNLRDYAIILVMATSGMARKEILNLRIKDIVFEDVSETGSKIGIISKRRDKNQVDFVTFISPEAVIALKNYFDERNRDPDLKIKSESDHVFVTYVAGKNGGRGEPLGKRTFLKIFRELGEKFEEYKNGNYWIKTHSHGLRRFFATTLENAGLPKNKIEIMIAHTKNGNDEAYYDVHIDKLKKLYIKFLPYLTFERTLEVRSLDSKDAEELDRLRKSDEARKAEIDSMKYQMAVMSNLIERLASGTTDEKFIKDMRESGAAKLLWNEHDQMKGTLNNQNPVNPSTGDYTKTSIPTSNTLHKKAPTATKRYKVAAGTPTE